MIVKPLSPFSRCIFCDAIDKEKGDGVKYEILLCKWGQVHES